MALTKMYRLILTGLIWLGVSPLQPPKLGFEDSTLSKDLNVVTGIRYMGGGNYERIYHCWKE